MSVPASIVINQMTGLVTPKIRAHAHTCPGDSLQILSVYSRQFTK